MQEFQWFFSTAQKFHRKHLQTNKNSHEKGDCEFDKKKIQGAGFSVTRIMLESAAEMGNLYVESVSEG